MGNPVIGYEEQNMAEDQVFFYLEDKDGTAFL